VRRWSHVSIKSHEPACDISLKITLEGLIFLDFWICVRNEYVELSQLAIDVLLQIFSTTHLCDKTSSVMAAIKSKCRNRLQLENGLRDTVWTIHSEMSHPVPNMQAFPTVYVLSSFYVKSRTVRKILFVFKWWRQKKRLGTTALKRHMPSYWALKQVV
jgi:hypothetical protein